MRISAYKLYRMTLHCLLPFKIATGLREACDSLLLVLEDETGKRGFGEAIPIPLLTDECLPGCEWSLVEELLPLLRGRHAWALDDLHRDMLKTTRSKSARCCIDVAMHNLQAAILEIPLSKLLGSEATCFPTNYSIGICSLDETEDLARRYEAQGYDRIKLKVGLDSDNDLERILRLSEVLKPSTMLRLDANCGWSRSEAIRVLRKCERHDCRIELVEQPVAKDDFHGLREVREKSAYPVAADESVQDLESARRLVEDRCVDILNLKLMKSGGLWHARRIAALAQAHHCRLMIGGMVGESEISVGAAAALAASQGFDFADLDADILLKDGPFQDCPPAGGTLRLEIPYRSWDEQPEAGPRALREDLELVCEWQA